MHKAEAPLQGCDVNLLHTPSLVVATKRTWRGSSSRVHNVVVLLGEWGWVTDLVEVQGDVLYCN